MKKEEVPQEPAKAFGGRKKALYATDENGNYIVVGSRGWEAEEIVLDQAIAEFERSAAEALDRARQGLSAPLEYHMYRRRMDSLVLAQSAGFFHWQVRRHLKPDVFSRLSPTQKSRYAEALGVSVAELDTLPEKP
jgi:hypothetical protein